MGNSAAQMNYIIVKNLRKKTQYKPDLLLQSYGSRIYGHPAWEDVPVKIKQDLIRNNPKEAAKILDQAIQENNWNMPSWVIENPIKYSIFDKFMTKYIDKFHITKKQIKHHITDMKNYDFIFTDGFTGVTAMLAQIKFAIRPYGGDIDIFAFEKNYRGKMVRKAFNASKAVLMFTNIPSIKKLGLLEKFQQNSYVINTDLMKPEPQKSNDNTEFFLASRLDFALKGTDKAIKAFAKLLQTYDARLYCLNFGSDVQKTRVLINSLGIQKNVIIYDFVASKPVLAELYNKHDATICDLNNVGIIGSTGFEALACEKPVIGYTKTDYNLEKEMPILNSFSESEIYINMKKVCEKQNLPTGMRNYVLKYFGFENFLKTFESLVN